MDYINEYKRWLENVINPELMAELDSMDEAQIEDAFYRDLAFGTGGLRGIIGAGTNRMNTHVVAKASQGLAGYLGPGASAVIGYDSRIRSYRFARMTASVLAANGIKVYIWPRLLPVPTVSFGVRRLGASAGVMITASHNPAEYNGYKVYGTDGCQITAEAAASIMAQIESVDIFSNVKTMDFDIAVAEGKICTISEEILDEYIKEMKGQSVLFGDVIDPDLAIVYSPLNGTGLIPVTRALEESGFTNITLVKEQQDPDGHFPTCPYPNPEEREAMELGLSYCEQTGADLLLATDPDCDRCGIAVKVSDDVNYRLLTANETGLLLLDYICSQRVKHGKMPDHPVFAKTIVTTDLAEKVAAHYGVRTVNVLTGFKYIGEMIGLLEQEGRPSDYIFGFEESYGYLSGTYVRDKDGVNAAYLICEMFAYYKTRGIALIDRLQRIYDTFGYCKNTLHSYKFPGSAGMAQMREIMDRFRQNPTEIAGWSIEKIEDYKEGLHGLPNSNVIKFYLQGGSTVVVRPSGTEPKIKLYLSIISEDEKAAGRMEAVIAGELEKRIMG